MDSTRVPDTSDRWAALDEFRPQAILGVAAVATVGGLACDFWFSVGAGRLGIPFSPIGAGSFAVGVITLMLLRSSTIGATAALAAGMAAVLTVAVLQLPGYPVVVGFAPVVVLLGILFDWRGGLIGASGATAIIMVLSTSTIPAIPGPHAEVALILVWISALLAWLGTRPIALALDWSWSSYMLALRTTDLLRDRQAELARVNRSLNDAFQRLEDVNKELERARRAAVSARQLRDRFAATVSHEMRTPLNIIVGFTEVMVETPLSYYGERLPIAYEDDVRAIYRNASHLSNLVDDILDLAQIESDQLTLHKEAGNIAEIVEESVGVVATLLAAKSLSLEVILADQLPDIQFDRVRVRQILINLMSNAARFTVRGGIRIEAREQGNDVIVSVSDTGAGIPRAYIGRIFEEFGQVAAPGRGVTGGSGLGLTISKRLAELHGGNLWVESTPGNGSTFAFSLPKAATVAANTIRRPWETRTIASVSDRPSPVVALVEESPASRILERHLRGYQIVTMTDPDLAIAAADRLAAAAVLVVGSIKSVIHQQTKHLRASLDVPVIRCLLRAPVGLRPELGVHVHLAKPVSRERLAAAIAECADVSRCLVVDDEPEMVRLLERTVRLSHPDWEIRTACGGGEALLLMDSWVPDLLLLDLLMPEVDGYEVLTRMRTNDQLTHVQVVVVSAHGREGETMVATEIHLFAHGGLGPTSLLRVLTTSLDAIANESDNTAPELRVTEED